MSREPGNKSAYDTWLKEQIAVLNQRVDRIVERVIAAEDAIDDRDDDDETFLPSNDSQELERLKSSAKFWEDSYNKLLQRPVVTRELYNVAVSELTRQRDYHASEAREWRGKYNDLQNQTDDLINERGPIDYSADLVELRKLVDDGMQEIERLRKLYQDTFQARNYYCEKLVASQAKVRELSERNNRLRDEVVRGIEGYSKEEGFKK